MSAKGISLITSLASNLAVLVLLAVAINILPNSPFQSVIEGSTKSGTFYQYLGYVSYFIPVDRIIVTLEVWIVCITNYWFFELLCKCFSGASNIASLGGLSSLAGKK